MKKLVMFAFGALALAPAAMSAQTANGTLTVTATVNGSIQMIFNSDASGLALSSGAGTNAATLAFGNISAYGAIPGTVTRTVGGSSFTVSTPVDVNVSKTNVTSTGYTLKAQLGASDTVNTWQVAGTTVTNGSAATITSSGVYATNTATAIALTVPFTSASGTAISNSIAFTATAN